MKEKTKAWYRLGLWTKSMIHQAVEKGVLTQGEAEEIISAKEK